MKNNNLPIILGFAALMFIFIITTSCKTQSVQEKWQDCIDNSNGSDIECYECDMKYIELDLPEEYSQATPNDTLIAIKKGSTLFVQFNNK